MKIKHIIGCILILMCIFFMNSCSYNYVDDYDINIDNSFNHINNDSVNNNKKGNSNNATGTISFGVPDVKEG